jgi:hypothetical protein
VLRDHACHRETEFLKEIGERLPQSMKLAASLELVLT